MDFVDSIGSSSDSPYKLLLNALLLIPISHYILFILFVLILFLYNFLEIHIVQDLFTGFRGQSVELLFNSSSDVYQQVVSKCKILHERYLSTPWLCSPHLQTVFLSFLGNAPALSYKRQIFLTSDGGTIGLDWVTSNDVEEPTVRRQHEGHSDNRDPIMIVIPGLTSDSDSAYLKHLSFVAAKSGWKVVVSNHRGLGGVSMTSDIFYNAGWTEDIRRVVDHIHNQYPEAPLFLVGTSIGANVLVKYLGEDGANVPVIGAAAICSPWDLLICDRFINRRRVQRFYDQALVIGLKGYAQLHQSILSRLADWDGIAKSCSVRDFDNYATRLLGKYETVDTYYRRNTSAPYVGNVAVPLLCISALDDPVCTHEAIPWDECRANKNVILATTQHGGHLAYFEGLTAKNIWWVKAVNEFFSVLLTSSFIHKKKEVQVSSSPMNPLDSSIDQAPFINLIDDGMVAPSAEHVMTDVGDARTTGADSDEARDGGAIASAEMKDQPVNEKTKLPEEKDLRPDQRLTNPLSYAPHQYVSQVQVSSSPMNPLDSSIDQAPFINLIDDGMVAPSAEHVMTDVGDARTTGADSDEARDGGAIASAEMKDQPVNEKTKLPEEKDLRPDQRLSNIIAPITKRVDQLSRQSSKSFWLLLYVALATTWPFVGSALLFFFKKKSRNVFSSTLPNS